MDIDELEEMGPVDYVLVEWRGRQPQGEVAPYENRWAAPFAAAVRRSGGQLVADGRIPIQSILAALDAAEEMS